MTPTEREHRRAELLAELVELAEQELPKPVKSLDELEELTARVGQETTRQVLEKLAQRQQEPALPTEHTCATCQRRAQYKGRYGLELVTSLGRIRLRRPYFYCRSCRQGCVPVDAAWRLGPANTTPQAQARVAYLAHAMPYHRLPASFPQLGLPLRLDVSTCEKITQQLGVALAAHPPAGPEESAGLLVLQVDGVLFPTRDGYREAQCGVLYEPEGEDAAPEGDAGGRKEFWGTVQDRAGVIAEACRRLEARRSSPQQRVGVMGDGAHWIWDDLAPKVPNRREMLDFYHATEPLAKVAAARFAGEAEERAHWLGEMRHELRYVGPWRVIREVERWRPETEAAQKVRREELGYLRRNRERMHYPTYVREGFPIGTGAVEGACKNLVGARLKGAGMRWNVATAAPVVHVRAAVLTTPRIDLRAYAGGSAATALH